MIRNVFIKSIQRQPVRNLLLILLIGAASFSFVLRAAEYIIVQNEIKRIENFYRAVGFVADIDNTRFQMMACITDPEWQEIIESSPFVAHIDRRVSVLGLLNNTTNANTVKCPNVLSFESMTGNRFYINDAYFYGTLTSRRVYEYDGDHDEQVRAVFMYFNVDEVIVGHPEYITAGKRLRLAVPVDDISNPQHPALEMQIGRRYLVRGSWSNMFYVLVDSMIPQRIWRLDYVTHGTVLPNHYFYGLYIEPLHAETDMYFFPANDPGLDDILALLYPRMFDLHKNIRSVDLRTTTDMSAMYVHSTGIELKSGRLLTRDDYLQANPVAVIHQHFADSRGLQVGDTFAVRDDNPQADFVTGLQHSADNQSLNIGDVLEITLQNNDGSQLIWGLTYDGLHFEWDENPYEISVEIVGIFHYPDIPTIQTTWSRQIYIPASLIPPGFIHSYNITTFDNNYTFILHSARDIDNFHHTHERELLALGYAARFVVNPGAENLFIAVDSIMLTMRFNLILFTILAIFILSLATFIYTFIIRKNFTILRSMGHSALKVSWQLVYPVFLCWLPAIVAGSFFAWRFALVTAKNHLDPLYDLDHSLQHMAGEAVNELWLTGLLFAAVFAALIALAFGSGILAKRPILRLLQGR
jgi:hypothetical protein